jgi:hypothetical protein
MNIRQLLLGLALAGSTVAAASLPASAQMVSPGWQSYDSWQPGWDSNQFDRRHVILGTVANFQPFRLQVARNNGTVQTIDLKNGTVILPTGETPGTNARVAVVGYYSRGTFIANRVILRD